MREPERFHSSPLRTWLPRGVLVLASIGLVLALAEIALRFTPDRPWHVRIEERVARHQFPVRPVGDKRFRLRDGLPDARGSEDESFRILFLGDSFTYGSGVENARAVFPALVTQQLQALEEEDSARRFEFFNGGIPGSLTRAWVQLYREVADRFDTQMVVVVFFLRDGAAGLGSRSKLGSIREATLELRRESFLFAHSRLLRELFDRKLRQDVSSDYLTAMEKAYLGDAQATKEWRNAQANLLVLRDAAQQRGSDFVLVIFPMLYGLDGDYPLASVITEIERFAKENDVPSFSLLPAFEGQDEAGLWVSSEDQHPNERGHAIAAEAMVGFLAPRISPAGSAPSPLPWGPQAAAEAIPTRVFQRRGE